MTAGFAAGLVALAGLDGLRAAVLAIGLGLTARLAAGLGAVMDGRVTGLAGFASLRGVAARADAAVGSYSVDWGRGLVALAIVLTCSGLAGFPGDVQICDGMRTGERQLC